LLQTLVTATANTGRQCYKSRSQVMHALPSLVALLQTLVAGVTKVGRMFYLGRSVRHYSQQAWRKVRLATTVLRTSSGGVGRRWQVLGMWCDGTRKKCETFLLHVVPMGTWANLDKPVNPDPRYTHDCISRSKRRGIDSPEDAQHDLQTYRVHSKYWQYKHTS
jgi:hypothetical protein